VFLDKPAVISWVKADSPAAKAGLESGDRITRIDGVQDPTWEQVYQKVMLSANQPLDITVQRGGSSFEKQVVPVPVTVNEVGSAGWYANESVVVGNLEKNMPAAKSGIQEGDKVIAMDGKALPSIDTMIERLQETKDKPVTLSVDRSGKQMEFTVQPVLADAGAESPAAKRYRIGFQNAPETKVSRLSLSEAFNRSLDENKKGSVMILQLVKKMVERKVSMRTISGPIGIAQQAGEAAQEKGWIPLLALTSAISLNLGIFNLLPIPILDGGVIMLLFVESLMRRDISMPIKERIYQAAFVFLVLFAVMVIYNDLVKTLPGVMQRLP